MDDTPNYADYSFDELLNASRRVDRKAYPERYAAIMQEIGKYRDTQPSSLAAFDPAVLIVLRLFGGMVLALGLPLLLVGLALVADVSYKFGIVLPEILVAITMMIAITAGGVYAALHLQEAKVARSPLPMGMRFILGCLSVLLRFCGGGVLAYFVCLPLVMLVMNSSFIVSGSPLETVAMVLIGGIQLLGAVLAVWLPLGRKKWF